VEITRSKLVGGTVVLAGGACLGYGPGCPGRSQQRRKVRLIAVTLVQRRLTHTVTRLITLSWGLFISFVCSQIHEQSKTISIKLYVNKTYKALIAVVN